MGGGRGTSHPSGHGLQDSSCHAVGPDVDPRYAGLVVVFNAAVVVDTIAEPPGRHRPATLADGGRGPVGRQGQQPRRVNRGPANQSRVRWPSVHRTEYSMITW